ncbi:uncharacterized protein LOC135254144 [Anguilla rostrata]|uniref:uncharacterized protein LOC135254144 n=1 Tax=Anguilla rostrata TaxID=7938 RepID=UPI0030D325AE
MARTAGWGPFFSQEVEGVDRPVLYISRKLSQWKAKYSKVEKECLVIKTRFRRRGPPRRRNLSNLCYPSLTFCDNFIVAGGLWNCQSATWKADLILAYASLLSLHFLTLTETWITPGNTATTAALSSSFSFSHTPCPSGHGGGTEDGTPLILLGDFNIHLDVSHSAVFLPLLHSFDLSLMHSPPTHKAGNLLDLVILRNCSSSDPTVIPLHHTPPPPPQSSLAADDFAVFFNEKIADIRSSFTSTTTLPHSPLSSGFRPGHLTETVLLSVSESLHAAQAASHSSVLILLDVSAAFDTVDHPILLSSLAAMGICGTALDWIESYLSGRSFQVAWAGAVSAPRPLATGVPQGSVFGPLLFSLYTQSLGPVISAHGLSYHCYADDTQLFLSFPPSDTQVSARISACLRDIQSWMDNHHLKLNPGDTVVSSSPTAKNLGVVMDNRLSLSQNITAVSRTCRFFLYNIRRIRPFLTTYATQLLVQAMVLSRLDYCNSLLQLQNPPSDPCSSSRMLQRVWSTTSPDIPMSPPCSLTSTGCLLWLASNLRPWCLHTRQLRGQHQDTSRRSSDPTHQPDLSVLPPLDAWNLPLFVSVLPARVCCLSWPLADGMTSPWRSEQQRI